MHTNMASLLLAALLPLLLLLGVAPASTVAQPPFSVNFTSYRALAATLRATPYSPDLFDQIILAAERSMPLYPFEPLSRDSSVGAPNGTSFFALSYPLLEALQQLKDQRNNISSDYDMNEAIAQVFRPLQDAHTAYHKNYGTTAFTLPFRLNCHQVADSGTGAQPVQKLFIHENALADGLYRSVYGYTPLANTTLVSGPGPLPSTLDGFEVKTIDGMDALEYLWNVAVLQSGVSYGFDVGVSRDPHTRFNLLVHGFNADLDGPPGWFSYRPQRSFGIPPNELVHLHLYDASTGSTYGVTYQWIGMLPANGALDFDPKTFPHTRAPQNDSMLERRRIEEHYWQIHSLQHPALWQQKQHVLGVPESQRTASPPPPSTKPGRVWTADTPRLVDAGLVNDVSIPGEISWSYLSDLTGVLRIQTFEPNSTSDFLSLIQTMVTYHQLKMNGTKLIIDLRANGGGDVCLGYTVLRFLFPAILQPSYSFDADSAPWGRYDLIVNPLTQHMADAGAENLRDFPAGNTCGFYTPCGWVDPQTQLLYANESWYNSQRVFTRGGETRAYTNLIHLQCVPLFATLAPANLNPGYSPRTTMLISDGMCGSTCAVFASFIHYHVLAKTVALGGIDLGADTPPMQVWSFPGGQLSDVDSVRFQAISYGLAWNDTLVPPSITALNGAQLTFTLREIYAWDDYSGVYPLEFINVPAHFHFFYATNFTDTFGIYSDLINNKKVFSDAQCVEGITPLACSVLNGQGQYGCTNGVQNNTCTATVCDGGFFLDPVGNLCIPCPQGTYRVASLDPSTQLSCTQCPVTTAIVAQDGVDCQYAFNTPQQSTPLCPATVLCSVSGGGGASGGGVSRGVVIGLFVALSVVIFGLISYIIITKRMSRQSASSYALDTEANFSRMVE